MTGEAHATTPANLRDELGALPAHGGISEQFADRHRRLMAFHLYEFRIGGLRCRDPEKFDLGRTDRDVGDARRANRRIRLRQ